MAEHRICFVVYDRGEHPDAMLDKVVHRLNAAGMHVAGLRQEGRSGDALSCATLVLEDIATGRRIQIFERRGTQARGCRLDASGLAIAAGWVREAIQTRPDVLFINRFGRQECEGRGLLAEIGAAVEAEIPIVVAINKRLLPKWSAFAGEDSAFITADPEQLEAWCLAAVRQPTGLEDLGHEGIAGGVKRQP